MRALEVGLGEQEALREHLLVLETVEQDSGREGKGKNLPGEGSLSQDSLAQARR